MITAAKYNAPEVAKVIIDAGANVDAANRVRMLADTVLVGLPRRISGGLEDTPPQS